MLNTNAEQAPACRNESKDWRGTQRIGAVKVGIAGRREPTLRFVVAVVLLAACGTAVAKEPQADPQRFADAIAAFEEADRQSPPPEGVVLFVGSSSIRRWDLERWFPDLKTLNRGFGGSQYSDAVYYAERIIWPYKPSAIVLFEGGNDLNAGKSPQTVAADFRALLGKIRQRHPRVPVYVLAINQAIKRWHLRDEVREANRLIRQSIEQSGDEQITMFDAESRILGPDGTPQPQMFVADELHLSDEGYRIWVEMLRPLLSGEK